MSLRYPEQRDALRESTMREAFDASTDDSRRTALLHVVDLLNYVDELEARVNRLRNENDFLHMLLGDDNRYDPPIAPASQYREDE